MERRDIRQLKDALHAAELDSISFGCANICITTMSGQVLNAEEFIRGRIRDVLRSAIAVPITSVLERHGWNGEY